MATWELASELQNEKGLEAQREGTEPDRDQRGDARRKQQGQEIRRKGREV